VKIEAAANAEQRRVLAEAEAIAVERAGQAEARATQARGEAEASAVKAKGMAEAEAIEARVHTLETNDQAVINVQIAEQLPEIVRAAAESFKGIDHLVVLNGAEGMSGMLSQVMGAGVAGVSMFRDLLADRAERTNGGDESRASRVASRDPGEPRAASPRSSHLSPSRAWADDRARDDLRSGERWFKVGRSGVLVERRRPCFSASTSTRSMTRTASPSRPSSARRSRRAWFSPAGSNPASRPTRPACGPIAWSGGSTRSTRSAARRAR
jgi:hypothetical protein